MITQTILLDPSGPVWTDAAPNVSRQDPTSAVQSDAEHLARNRKVKVEPTPLRYVGVPPTHLGRVWGSLPDGAGGWLAPDAWCR